MNETEMLALGEALARTADVLRVGEHVSFRDYVRRVLNGDEGQIAALFADGGFLISVDRQPVDGDESSVPVTSRSRVVLYRRQGAMLDVLNRAAVRRICLN
jgi:hypothetical protein